MKIYFTQSARLPKERSEAIKEAIKELGHKVDIRNIPTLTDKVDMEMAKKIYKLNVNAIRASDVVVAEISFMSTALGYEISLALDEKKPVIALYNLSDYPTHAGAHYKIPIPFKGNTSNYFFLKEYEAKTLKKTLGLAFNDAKSVIDTKFILIIPAAIDRYLEWNVKEKNKPKAVITREAIEKVMLDDKNYQAYLKSQDVVE